MADWRILSVVAVAALSISSCGGGSAGPGVDDRPIGIPDVADARDTAVADQAQDTVGPEDGGEGEGEEVTAPVEGDDIATEQAVSDAGDVFGDSNADEGAASETAGDDGPELPPVGMIKVVPAIVDFAYVPAGAQAKLPFQVQNVGGGALSVTRYTIKGSSALTLVVGFDPKPLSGGVVEYKVQPPKILKPGAAIDALVKFAPLGPEPAEAEIRVYSSDAQYPDGYPIFASGNTKTPCLRFSPDSIDFGVVVLGKPVEKVVKLESCGEVPVTVTSISLDAAGVAGGVTLGFDWFPNGQAPSPEMPLFIGGEEAYELKVRFNPAKLSAIGPDGKAIPQKFKVTAKDDSFLGMKTLDIQAVVVDKACVKTNITVAEGLKVSVGTLLHLSSAGSFSQFGAIVKHQWSVTMQPPENGGWLMPGPEAPAPAFMAGAPGDYEFRLRLWDEAGNPSCNEAVAVVNATSLQRATFVVTWESVNPIVDPVPPHLGQDVDLHLVHPNAVGPDLNEDGKPDGYYDETYDCFWFNPDPSWGVAPDPHIEDETRMIADSQVPPGPEVIEQGLVCQKKVFKVGVHVFDDWYYGPIKAKLRVFVVGSLQYEAETELEAFDMWEAGRFDCGTGTFIPNPGPQVMKNYINPVFQVPH